MTSPLILLFGVELHATDFISIKEDTNKIELNKLPNDKISKI